MWVTQLASFQLKFYNYSVVIKGRFNFIRNFIKYNNLFMIRKILASVAVASAPLVALAQYTPSQGITGLINFAHYLTGLILPVLIGVAVVYFIYEVFMYTIAGDQEKKDAAKGGIVRGIIGIFVMVSVWGLVGILVSTFGTSGSGVTLPTLP